MVTQKKRRENRIERRIKERTELVEERILLIFSRTSGSRQIRFFLLYFWHWMPCQVKWMYTCYTNIGTLNMDTWRSRDRRKKNIIRVWPQAEASTLILFSWCAQVHAHSRKNRRVCIGETWTVSLSESVRMHYRICVAISMLHTWTEPNKCGSSGTTPKYRIDSNRTSFHQPAAPIHVVSLLLRIDETLKWERRRNSVQRRLKFSKASIKVQSIWSLNQNRLCWIWIGEGVHHPIPSPLLPSLISISHQKR